MFNLEHFIRVEHNVLPDAVCRALLEEYAGSSEWVPAKTIAGVNPNIRNCDTIKMSTVESLAVNRPTRVELDNKILGSLYLAAKSYFEQFPRATCKQDSGYELLRYREGGFFKEHVDYNAAVTQRQVSFSFALNDDYEGGEFKFAGSDRLYRIPKGACLAFPSNFVFPHQILPVTSGTRYSVVTWMY
jgi:predicted 2-oxoglutarate/Fe(II)-dependent dioxygenase YbiX